MNKKILLKEISEKTGIPRKDSEAVLEAFIKCVQESLARGEKVSLVGFGCFKARDRFERMVNNPSTGEKMTVPSGRTPVFKAGKSLKDALR